jgi:hypothetical protein
VQFYTINDPVNNVKAIELSDGENQYGYGGLMGWTAGWWYIQFGSDGVAGDGGGGVTESMDLSRFANGTLKFDCIADAYLEVDIYSNSQKYSYIICPDGGYDWSIAEVPLSVFGIPSTALQNVTSIAFVDWVNTSGAHDPNFAVGNVRLDEATTTMTAYGAYTDYTHDAGSAYVIPTNSLGYPIWPLQ